MRNANPDAFQVLDLRRGYHFDDVCSMIRRARVVVLELAYELLDLVKRYAREIGSVTVLNNSNVRRSFATVAGGNGLVPAVAE